MKDVGFECHAWCKDAYGGVFLVKVDARVADHKAPDRHVGGDNLDNVPRSTTVDNHGAVSDEGDGPVDPQVPSIGTGGNVHRVAGSCRREEPTDGSELSLGRCSRGHIARRGVFLGGARWGHEQAHQCEHLPQGPRARTEVVGSRSTHRVAPSWFVFRGLLSGWLLANSGLYARRWKKKPTTMSTAAATASQYPVPNSA